MDFETLFETFVLLFTQSDSNIWFFVYAIATAILTQICKKLFVNKMEVEIFHKFNIAQVLPYVFAVAFSVFDLFVIKKPTEFQIQLLSNCIVEAVSIGAISTVLYHVAVSFFGQNLSALLKNNAFEILYTQLINFSQLREKIKSGEVKFFDAIKQIKQAAQQLEEIYKSDTNEMQRLDNLSTVLKKFVDTQTCQSILTTIDEAFCKNYSNSNQNVEISSQTASKDVAVKSETTISSIETTTTVSTVEKTVVQSNQGIEMLENDEKAQ